MSCKHEYIRTWVFEDTKEPSGLWSCVDCGLKFEPITQRQWVGLTRDERMDIINRFNGQDWIYAVDAIEAKLKEKNT